MAKILNRLPRPLQGKVGSCPACLVDLQCDCGTCTRRREVGAIPTVHVLKHEGNDIMRCSNCHLSGHIDEWFDADWKRASKDEREGKE